MEHADPVGRAHSEVSRPADCHPERVVHESNHEMLLLEGVGGFLFPVPLKSQNPPGWADWRKGMLGQVGVESR